jgi:hypothetical protein
VREKYKRNKREPKRKREVTKEEKKNRNLPRRIREKRNQNKLRSRRANKGYPKQMMNMVVSTVDYWD